MIKRENYRKLEILVDGAWVQADFGQLEDGDIFRLFEPDGTAVEDKYGDYKWVFVGHHFVDGRVTYMTVGAPVNPEPVILP